jgi:hypothetical protein
VRYSRRHRTSIEDTRAAAIAERVPGPLTARYLDEDDGSYLVGEPGGERTAQVQKRREIPELFPPGQGAHAPGVWLLRWSAAALVGAACGGVLGIALGGAVVCVALARLGRFAGRMGQWQRQRRGADGLPALPEAATIERLRLLSALGQGLLAAVLGGLVFLTLTGRL